MINFIFATSLQPLDDDDQNVPQQVFDLASYNTIKLRADKDIQLTGNITLGSTDQTRIFSDIRLPEIADYIKGTSTEDLSIKLETYSSTDDTENLRILTVKELTELIYQDDIVDGTKIICCSKITRIDTTKPRFFTSCPLGNCRKKLIHEEGKLKCEKCGKIVDTPIIRYRIEFEAEDHTGSTIFVLLDKLAENLIQIPVTALLSDNTEDGIPALLPDAIKNLIGTTHSFQIKLNNFNLIGKREGFTVNKLVKNEIEDSTNQITTVVQGRTSTHVHKPIAAEQDKEKSTKKKKKC
ncbi:hypothetical protein RND81_05G135900 [Saponaria officinalis]|uniref:Replication factor A C-terminal domain-containing protein n=1 Tax=Saponaria officinalis TaxID=3572 RepID=A0AAW1KXS3_SAPOF